MAQQQKITMDRLRAKKAAEVVVVFPDDDAALDAVNDARDEVSRAQLLDGDVDAAKATLKAAEDNLRETGVVFVFRAIGRAKYEEENTWRSAYDKIEADLQSQIRELERKAGEEQ